MRSINTPGFSFSTIVSHSCLWKLSLLFKWVLVLASWLRVWPGVSHKQPTFQAIEAVGSSLRHDFAQNRGTEILEK